MWDFLVLVPDNCLSFYFKCFLLQNINEDSDATLNISCYKIHMKTVCNFEYFLIQNEYKDSLLLRLFLIIEY